MTWLRTHLTYPTVLAMLALFLAIGGGAYAAKLAKRNSVVSKSVKNASLTGDDVKDDSLTGSDIDEATLTLPPGQKGDKGDAGTPGGSGNNVVMRSSGNSTVSPTDSNFVNYPLNGASWTQAADESDLRIFGTITYDGNGCLNSVAFPAPLQLSVKVDGVEKAPQPSFGTTAAGVQTRFFEIDAELLETGAPVAHTLTAGVRELCSGGGDPIVTGLKVFVEGIR